MANAEKKKHTAIDNWKRTQYYIRIEHNKKVTAWFRIAGTQARLNLRNSLFIYAKDTASQILVKIEFFNTYIRELEDELLTLPLQYSTRKLPNVAQLAIIYRPTDKNNKSGNYTLHIPQCDSFSLNVLISTGTTS